MSKKLMMTAGLLVVVFVGLQIARNYRIVEPTIVVAKNSVINQKSGVVPIDNVITDSSSAVSNSTKNENTTDIKKLELDLSRTLFLGSPIRENADEFVEALKDLESKSSAPIYLLIDSPGGSVIDGAAIVSQIESSKAPVYTVCVKVCASMAAVIHQYGHKRLAVNRTILMFHPASGGAEGQLDNMLSLLHTIARYVDKFDSHIAKRANINKDKFKQLTSFELWLDAEDAKAYNFVDEVVSLDIINAKRKSIKLKSSKSVESSEVRTLGSPGGSKGFFVLEN